MIRVSQPHFGADVEALVLEVLRSGHVAQGPMVARLEALRRCGWIHGPEAAYQFTDTGRQIAEYSESAGPLDRNLPIDGLLAGISSK